MNIKEKAYAKLNLSIDIVSKMENGYHNMRMVMQSVALCDDISISCEPGEGISVTTNLRYLPNDDRNIASRAAHVFFEHTGVSGYHTAIDINKNIPVCAGMGGGSTDGAAVLRALNTMFDCGLDRKTLELLAEKVGSDVPFCIVGGTSLAEGRGEILTDLEPLPYCAIVICKPPFSISTPDLFSRVKCEKIRLRPDTNGIVDALTNHCLGDVARRMYNVFEDVLPKGTGAISEIKTKLNDFSALNSVMTGTGSAVFGIFDNRQSATAAYRELKKNYQECYLTSPSARLALS